MSVYELGLGSGASYRLITPPCKVHGFPNGDAVEAIDAESDGLDIDR